MVEIKPFCGWCYDTKKAGDIKNLVSPPHDVISDEEQDKLYSRSPYGIVRVILPLDGPGESADAVKGMVKQRILVKDEKPAYYVYEHEFSHLGKKARRTGFLAIIRAEPFGENILPHEEIFPEKVQERLRLQRICKADTSPIFGLYDDKESMIREILDSAKEGSPRFDFTDDNGVVHRLWPLQDTDEITDFFKGAKVIIADGHHRYTAAAILAGEGGAQDTLFYLADMNDPAMLVLPTHRFLNCEDFDLDGFLKRAQEFFDVEPAKDIHELEVAINRSKKHTFGVHTKDRSYTLKLKDPSIIEKVVDGNKSVDWKNLETSVLHKLVLNKIAGVDDGDVLFAKHKDDVIRLIDNGECKVAFMLRHSDVRDVEKIVKNNERMPKKSTYFYPKPYAGLVVRIID